MNSRPRAGAFFQIGAGAQKRTFDQCNLVNAGIKSAVIDRADRSSGDLPGRHEGVPPGALAIVRTSSCPARTRCRSTSSSAPSISSPVACRTATIGGNSVLATWSTTPASATTLGRAYSAGADHQDVNLIANGANYGTENLNQLDLRVAEALQDRQVSIPGEPRRVQSPQQQLALRGHQHVLDGRHVGVSPSDQRAAVAVRQDRRAVRFLKR